MEFISVAAVWQTEAAARKLAQGGYELGWEPVDFRAWKLITSVLSCPYNHLEMADRKRGARP